MLVTESATDTIQGISTCPFASIHSETPANLSCWHAAIVKPEAGPSGQTYNEEDWNTEVDENAQGANAYRYSKVQHTCSLHNKCQSSKQLMHRSYEKLLYKAMEQ